MNNIMSNLYNGVVVNQNHYYTSNELEEIKKYVSNYLVYEKEKKLQVINDKLKRIKRR
jgi:hypothetical protein